MKIKRSAKRFENRATDSPPAIVIGPPELCSSKPSMEDQLRFQQRATYELRSNTSKRFDELKSNIQPPPSLLPTPDVVAINEMKLGTSNQVAEIKFKLNKLQTSNQSITSPEIDSVNSSQNQRESYPKLPKPDLPTFDGTDPEEWLRKCEEYFILNATAEGQKLPICVTYLRGFADLWYDVWRFRNPVTNWSFFSAALYERFVPPSRAILAAGRATVEEQLRQRQYTIGDVQQVKEQPVAAYEKVMAAAEAKQMGEVQGDESLEDADELFEEMDEWGNEFLLGRHEDILVADVQNDLEDKAHKVFDNMSQLTSKTQDLEIARHMLDGMPKLIFVGPNADMLIGALSYGSEVIKAQFTATEFTTENLAKNIIDEIERNTNNDIEEAVKIGYLKTNSDFLKQDLDKMPSNSFVELWFGKMIMFVFDPGGNSLYCTSCGSIDSNGVKLDEGSDKFFEGKVGSGLAIEIKYFRRCVPKVLQNLLMGDDLHIGDGRAFVEAFKKIKVLMAYYGSSDISAPMHRGCSYGSSHCHEEGFLGGHKLLVLIDAMILENFVWDPGQSVISIYILEDKDVYERVGKDVVLMNTILEITKMIMTLGGTVGLVTWFGYMILDFARSCHDHESLFVSLNKEMPHSSVLIFETETVQLCITKQLQKPVNVKIMEGILIEIPEGSDYEEVKKSLVLFVDIKQLIFAICAHELKTMTRVKETMEIVIEGVVGPSFIIATESFVWDPGLVWGAYLTTLRTRWLFRGGICHDMTFYYNFNCIFEFTYLAFYDVIYLGSDISHVISYIGRENESH